MTRLLTHAGSLSRRVRLRTATYGLVLTLLVVFLVVPFVHAPGAGQIAEPGVEEGGYVTQIVVRTVNLPIGQFHEWFLDADLEDILPGSALIPRVVGTEMIDGTWGQVGARRRVLLHGGGSALEQITANNPPDYFAYRVWNIGGPGERLIRYIRGEFFVTSRPDGRTRVEWRYSLRPRTSLARPLVSAFASLGIQPFLESGIDAIKAGAERSVDEQANSSR